MTYTDFSNKMLLALYRESDGDTSAHVNMASLAEKYGVDVTKAFWIPNLKTEWAQIGWAHFPEDGTGRAETVVINLQGVRQAEMLQHDVLPPIAISKVSVGPNDVILHPLPQTNLSVSGPDEVELVPASDRIVRFDHNDPQYTVIAAGLSEIREAVREINDSNFDPEERDRILTSFDAASALWQATQLKVIQIKVGVLMVVEDARIFLGSTAKAVVAAILVDTIKAFVKTHLGIDLDAN